MQLEGKVAIVYGAAGAMGGAVARAFAAVLDLSCGAVVN